MSALRQALRLSCISEGLTPPRTLADIIAEIHRIGPIVWKADNAVWASMNEEARGEVLDRLDALQLEARAMVERATGCAWGDLLGANL